jgi:hypothetical protein
MTNLDDTTIQNIQNSSYNGFVNYSTWLVNLWLMNDEYSEEEVRRMVDASDDTRELASELQSWIEEQNPLQENGMWTDLVNSALQEVSWQELAENYFEEKETDNDD